MAQECSDIEEADSHRPGLQYDGVSAREIYWSERRNALAQRRLDALGRRARSQGLAVSSWKWVEESDAYWKTSFDRLRPVKTTILHGLQDTVILPSGSSQFVEQLLSRDPAFPVELHLIPGDHRLSSPEQV